MELAACLVAFFDRSWEDALDTVKRYGVRLVEPCSGGHIPRVHYDPVVLATDDRAFAEFHESIIVRNLEVCALACHGNPLHPDAARRDTARTDFEATCRLAEKLGVQRVDVLSGCPSGGPHDRSPNWIINSIFPDFKTAYQWQWKECLIPYWREAASIASHHGVRICVEPHGGDMVYNSETFFRLRDAVGPAIGVNIDPSHLFWMGIDPILMITELGDAIIYAHAKDVSLNHEVVRRYGLASSCEFDDWEKRSWVYRAIGFGHPEAFWRDYIIALRRAGYDDALTIEIEEPYLTTNDAFRQSVELLASVMPLDGPPTANWFESYEWHEAEIQ
jgi:sugar phosphate isomerase/epimerase